MVLTRAQRRKLHDLIDEETHRENVANLVNLRKRKKFSISTATNSNHSTGDAAVPIDGDDDDDDEVFASAVSDSSTTHTRQRLVDYGSRYETESRNFHLGRSSTKAALDVSAAMTSYNNLCSNFVLGENDRRNYGCDNYVAADEDASNASSSSPPEAAAANCTCYFLNLRKDIDLRKFSDVAHDMRHVWWRSTAETASTFSTAIVLVVCAAVVVMFWLVRSQTTSILMNSSKVLATDELSVDRTWRMIKFASGYIKHIFFS